jgi:hypothetical protein
VKKMRKAVEVGQKNNLPRPVSQPGPHPERQVATRPS